MKNEKQTKQGFWNKYSPMQLFYAFLFWSIFLLTIFLTGIYFIKNNSLVLKDFSLPLLALILTTGQLWQNESKNRFERDKYLQSRKDLYFDKKVEIALGVNNYLEQLSSELSKPYFGNELSFNHQKFVFVQMNFYRNVIDKAKFLFDKDFIEEINSIIDLTLKIQNEIQIMQNHLMINPNNRNHSNYIIAFENYNKYYNELFSSTNSFYDKFIKTINIEEC